MMRVTSIAIPDHVRAIALCGEPYSNFAAGGAFPEAAAELPYPSPPACIPHPIPISDTSAHARHAAPAEAD
ncbi:MAG: hypothetical protein ABJC33_03215 [Betaproteobacteria bacterium]